MCQQDWEGAQWDKGQKNTQREALPHSILVISSPRAEWLWWRQSCVPQPTSISSTGHSGLRYTTTHHFTDFVINTANRNTSREPHKHTLFPQHIYWASTMRLTLQENFLWRTTYPFCPHEYQTLDCLTAVTTGQPLYLSVLWRWQWRWQKDWLHRLSLTYRMSSIYSTCTPAPATQKQQVPIWVSIFSKWIILVQAGLPFLILGIFLYFHIFSFYTFCTTIVTCFLHGPFK